MASCDQRVVHPLFFFLLSPVRVSLYQRGLHTSAAAESRRFNEVKLEIEKKKRLKQTPLCDVHISYLPLPRSLPFLNY